jgi:hypothetical protein
METKKEAVLKERFNSMFKVGSKVMWRDSATTSYQKVTVKTEAFINYGLAVVFFEEIQSFCSIHPEFVIY